MTATMKLRFEEPIFVELELPGQDFPKKIDLFKCDRAVREADRQPSEDARWMFLQKFIATEMGFSEVGLEALNIWEGTAREFRDAVVQRMNQYTEHVKKKLDLIVSLPISTLDSQQNQIG